MLVHFYFYHAGFALHLMTIITLLLIVRGVCVKCLNLLQCLFGVLVCDSFLFLPENLGYLVVNLSCMETHRNYNLEALIRVGPSMTGVISVGCLIDAIMALLIVGTSWDGRLTRPLWPWGSSGSW